jgi:putative phosphotransacetylase
LCREHLDILFGKGYELTVVKPISQPGQFASNEFVTVQGSKGEISGVRILGPTRPETNIEISKTDSVKLGVDAPVRDSVDLANTPEVTLIGPKGSVHLISGVIIAWRHIHITPKDAERFGVKNKEIVMTAVVSGPRRLIFDDVLVRVSEKYALDFHIDTDEANASMLKTGDRVILIKKPSIDGDVKNLVTEGDIKQAIKEKRTILVSEKTIITPSAKDLAKRYDVLRFIEKK